MRNVQLTILSLAAAMFVHPVIGASVSGTASLTVQNSFSFSESRPLNFGTISVSKADSYSSGADSSFTLSPLGGVEVINNTNGGKVGLIKAGSPAVFTVANAAPHSDLTLEVSESVNLVHINGLIDNGQFELTDIIAVKDGSTEVIRSGNTVKTNLAGALELSLGATVMIEGDKEYRDGLYQGTYSIELQY